MPAMSPEEWKVAMNAMHKANDPLELMEEVRMVFADHIAGLEHHLEGLIVQGIPLQAVVCRTGYTMGDDGLGLTFSTMIYVDPKIVQRMKRSRGNENGKEGKQEGGGEKGERGQED